MEHTHALQNIDATQQLYFHMDGNFPSNLYQRD